MSYVNGKPVGLTYSSSTNKPVGLTELSSIAVTLVSATNFSGITLSSMGDINFTGLANNYIIKWNSTTSKWEVAAQSGGGGGGFDAFGVVRTPDAELTADSGPDTLTLDSSDNSVVITGDVGTTTVDFVVGQITTANISDIGNYATTASLNNYALNSTLTNYATTASLGNYATTASLNSYATTASLGNYATTASVAALELDDLFDVNAPTPGNGQVLMYFTGTGNWQATSISVTGGGATTFKDLTDTPSNYVGYANSFVVVNTDSDGLTFTPPTANAVIISDETSSPESLGVDEFLKTTLLGSSTNVPIYKFDKTTSSVPYAWPNGTLMTYQLSTSSFNLSDPSVWWTAVAPTFSHNTLGGLTTGNPHTQYATLSGATFTGNVLAPSVSATSLSATQINGGDLAVADYTNIQNNDILKWQSSTSSWVNASGNLSTSDTLAAGDIFYYNGTSVKKLEKPSTVAVLAINPATSTLSWIGVEEGGGNLTLVYNDSDGSIVFSAV